MTSQIVHTVVCCPMVGERICGHARAELPGAFEWGHLVEKGGMIAYRVEWWSGYATVNLL